MDILKRIDHAQQFCKFYADGAYSVEKEKWNYHVTPKFIEDIRQYIESLQLKLMHLQKQQAEPVAEVKVKMTGGNVGIATIIHEIYDPFRERLQAGDKLYTTPPQRKPLTDEQKQRLVTDWFAEDWAVKKALGLLDDYEAAHKIKEGT